MRFAIAVAVCSCGGCHTVAVGALVRVGVLTRKAADAVRKGGNVDYGYRMAITKSGRRQFFIAGD